MAKIDEREKRGLLIFTGCAVFIILTGIVFNLYDVYATGRVGSGKFDPQSFKALDGYQIIWVGVIMLIGVLIILITMLNSKSK